MDVVGHDHKRMEGVLAESGFALAKRFDYVGSDDRISQPKRAVVALSRAASRILKRMPGGVFLVAQTLLAVRAWLTIEAGREL